MSRRKRGWGEDLTPKKTTKKKRTKKKETRKVKDDDLDFDLDDPEVKAGDKAMKILDKALDKVPMSGIDLSEEVDEAEDEATRVAQRLGIDISTECPVCRTLGQCECTEEDRSFQRRIRFESPDSDATCRCDRCGGALSCVLIPRAGCTPPFELSHMTPVWGCAHCHGASLATVLVTNTRGK